ncbi:hypothetical protein RRG08_037713 [Elysia crispata]|uniref:Uncharacterized protein n=1 Tax=Elysia crispata TaxID=231223 RepID=A0AAE1DV60_9GAST|nr:hypothetical protein RRG08_037713 [Elysia crispata]
MVLFCAPAPTDPESCGTEETHFARPKGTVTTPLSPSPISGPRPRSERCNHGPSCLPRKVGLSRLSSAQHELTMQPSSSIRGTQSFLAGDSLASRIA